ncbi:MAG: signal peptidase I [Elainellaceae cyanobacterium]
MAKHEQNQGWAETAKVLGTSIVLALGIRTFIAQAFYIPSQSMEPTLQVNDRLIVEKVSYYFRDPERNEVIVFQAPESAITNCRLPPGTREDFIKRVVGLPGEQIEIRDGQLLINGASVPEPYIAGPPDYNWGPETVPEGAYLVLGDNRNNSCDGHVWGFLPRSNVVGRSVFRFWPPGRIGATEN